MTTLSPILSHQKMTDHIHAFFPMGPDDRELSLLQEQPESLAVTAQRIYKFIVGIDRGKPQVVNTHVDQLGDPFARLLLTRGIFPSTASEIIASLQAGPHARELKRINTFLIAEGGQIPYQEGTEQMNRSTRIIVAISTNPGIGPDILMSTDTGNNLLEVMSWDRVNRAFNFYQRLAHFWVWSGNSFHALPDPSRSKGPFSGHVNGGPIMKELRTPWQHWNSAEATIRKECLTPDDPLLSSPYFENKKDGQIFENLTRSGISHWNKSRIENLLSQGTVIRESHYLFRQILATTNVNLTSSSSCSRCITPSTEIALPFSFFANFEALAEAGIKPQVTPIKVSGSIYLQSLSDFAFELTDNWETTQSFPGDTHFAFFVPEPAFEDIDLLRKMIKSKIISKRLSACLLMVDFPNPIYSRYRLSLLEYIPPEITAGNKGEDLDKKFLHAIVQSGIHLDPNSPEGQFYSYWTTSEQDDWGDKFSLKVVTYFEKVRNACKTQEGYNHIVRLAESRRHQFKKTPQYEFALTFATNNIVDTENFFLEMTQEGIVRPIN